MKVCSGCASACGPKACWNETSKRDVFVAKPKAPGLDRIHLAGTTGVQASEAGAGLTNSQNPNTVVTGKGLRPALGNACGGWRLRRDGTPLALGSYWGLVPIAAMMWEPSFVL